ncbi:MAG: hypothetical protein ABI608_05995 [Rhizomicrobium sp.]
MKLILTITISAIMLAGCADTYNGSAMPKAAAALQQETVGCKARWTAKDFKTYSDWQACQLTAERAFARTIALTKMDAFEVYAADMHALAADRDANRVTDREVRSRANDIQWKFLADCGCKPRWKSRPAYANAYANYLLEPGVPMGAMSPGAAGGAVGNRN